MDSIEKTYDLPTGERLVVRAPTASGDLDALNTFFVGLPESERLYLRYDVTDRKTTRARLEQLDGEDHFRLVAEVGGRIIGDITLDREIFGWTRHVAQIRGIVEAAYEAKGVAAILFRGIVRLGEDHGVERLYAHVMPEQEGLVHALERAGFRREATLKGFGKDLRGKPHDIHVYTNDMEQVWRHLADELELMDVRIPG
jgi:RimJ/RimL family protein N-acetyltransferase